MMQKTALAGGGKEGPAEAAMTSGETWPARVTRTVWFFSSKAMTVCMGSSDGDAGFVVHEWRRTGLVGKGIERGPIGPWALIAFKQPDGFADERPGSVGEGEAEEGEGLARGVTGAHAWFLMVRVANGCR